MSIRKPKHILIAPLDWGLGHTTRCIPIIRHIQRLGHIPLFAGNDAQCSFIEESFGDIEKIHLGGYNVSYSSWNRVMQAGLLLQMPSIIKKIAAEQKWLRRLCAEREINGIISDNRYGLFHNSVPSVIITHQLQVRSGLGSIADSIVRQAHYKFLGRFREVWAADVPGAVNLGGALSHPVALPANTSYIGLLSQFEETAPAAEGSGSLLVLLSGPEPQRSKLSRILWRQVQGYEGNVMFVEGSSRAIAPAAIPDHAGYHKRLASRALYPLLRQADMVVCRSGYSTLMDLIALGKKAILIPTPGQTEQQYLGKRLHAQGIFYSSQQRGFNLMQALAEAARFAWRGHDFAGAFTGYKKVLEDWLETL